MATTSSYKIKPPKEGEGEGRQPLARWLDFMRDWLVVQKLWGVMELTDDHPYTDEELQKSYEARYIILDQLSETRRVMAGEHQRAAQVWRHLNQV
jgi:hypothetical protein